MSVDLSVPVVSCGDPYVYRQLTAESARGEYALSRVVDEWWRLSDEG